MDREEGKVSGERDTGKDVGRVAGTTVMGASLGGVIGAAKGSTMTGVGIGSAAGAAAGLGSILLKKGPDATLRQRVLTMDMILDRDINFYSGRNWGDKRGADSAEGPNPRPSSVSGLSWSGVPVST